MTSDLLHPTRSLDVDRVGSHFDFPDRGRVVINNAPSTQPPRELGWCLSGAGGIA